MSRKESSAARKGLIVVLTAAITLAGCFAGSYTVGVPVNALDTAKIKGHTLQKKESPAPMQTESRGQCAQ